MTWRCPEVIDDDQDHVVLIRCQRRAPWHRWFGAHRNRRPGVTTTWTRQLARSMKPAGHHEEVRP